MKNQLAKPIFPKESLQTLLVKKHCRIEVSEFIWFFLLQTVSVREVLAHTDPCVY